MFEFDEIMLFKIDTDQIEACNVADEFPEIVDELLQHFTPTRIPDIVDGIADICGGLTGAYLRKYI